MDGNGVERVTEGMYQYNMWTKENRFNVNELLRMTKEQRTDWDKKRRAIGFWK